MSDALSDFQYSAFISYSHADEKVAEWLQRALETYRTPKHLVGQQGRHGAIAARPGKVFRDRDELPSSASLSEEIETALAQSASLIVICSPASARSRWVNEEILAFKRLGRERRILSLIVAGEPWADEHGRPAEEECFPLALRYALDDDGQLGDERSEVIAADLRPGKDGRRAALLKLLAGMLGVGFDDLRQREAQRRQRRMLAITAAAVAGMLVTSTLAVMALVARDEAESQRQLAQQNFDLARSSVDQYLTRVSDSPELRAAGLEDLRRQLLQTAREFYQEFAAEQPTDALNEELGNAHHRLASISRIVGDADVARDELEIAIDTFERLVEASPDNDAYRSALAAAHSELGLVLMDVGDEEAEAHYQQALDLYRQLDARDSGDDYLRSALADVNDNYGQWLERQGRLDDAEPVLQEGLALREALAEANPEDADRQSRAGYSAVNLTSFFARQGKLERAREYGRIAAAYAEPPVAAHPRRADYRVGLAAAYENLGGIEMLLENYGASQAAYERSLAAKEALVMDHPSVVDYRMKLAGTLTNLGELNTRTAEYDQALPWYQRSIETLDWVLERTPESARARLFKSYTCNWQAQTLGHLGRHADAVDAWECAIAFDDRGDPQLEPALQAARAAAAG